MMRNPVVIIPVRMGSSRFPGKPLLTIQGKTLLRRCYEDVLRAHVTVPDIYITTPDRAIVDEIVHHWPDFPKKNVVWTSPDCRNGTERVAETVQLLNLPLDTVVVNCQADQYGFRTGTFIDGPVSLIHSGMFQVATTVCPLAPGDCDKRQVVKILLEEKGTKTQARRFTRQLPVSHMEPVYRHIGVYAASAGKFLEYTELPETKEERKQGLEQLRWEDPIGVYPIQDSPITIDTPEDIG